MANTFFLQKAYRTEVLDDKDVPIHSDCVAQLGLFPGMMIMIKSEARFTFGTARVSDELEAKYLGATRLMSANLQVSVGSQISVNRIKFPNATEITAAATGTRLLPARSCFWQRWPIHLKHQRKPGHMQPPLNWIRTTSMRHCTSCSNSSGMNTPSIMGQCVLNRSLLLRFSAAGNRRFIHIVTHVKWSSVLTNVFSSSSLAHSVRVRQHILKWSS